MYETHVVIYFWEMLVTMQGEGYKHIIGSLGTISLHFMLSAGSQSPRVSYWKRRLTDTGGEVGALPRWDRGNVLSLRTRCRPGAVLGPLPFGLSLNLL